MLTKFLPLAAAKCPPFKKKGMEGEVIIAPLEPPLLAATLQRGASAAHHGGATFCYHRLPRSRSDTG